MTARGTVKSAASGKVRIRGRSRCIFQRRMAATCSITDAINARNGTPALYRLTPADQFDVKGTYVSKRSIKEGVGAPLVAVGLDKNLDARKNFAIPRTYYGVTAVANFSGRRCTLSFEDPLATETTILQISMRERSILSQRSPSWPQRFRPDQCARDHDDPRREARLEMVMATHAGMTTEEFEKTVTDWITTAKHPKTGLITWMFCSIALRRSSVILSMSRSSGSICCIDSQILMTDEKNRCRNDI
jgi:hypothetical protein